MNFQKLPDNFTAKLLILLQELAARMSEVICSRSRAFTPKQLASISSAMATLGGFSSSGNSTAKTSAKPDVLGDAQARLITFVKNEAVESIHDMGPADLTQLLAAYQKWGINDRDFLNALTERMADETDRFTMFSGCF